MKNIKLFLLINILSLISLSLFAPIIHVNPSNPTGSLSPVINIPDAPPLRNISAFLDGGQENPYKIFFDSTTPTFSNNPITFDLLISLTTDTKNPIFLSESIMNNLVARQTVIQDFLTLSDNELTLKYGSIPLFNYENDRTLFKEICKTINEDNINIKNAFKEFQTAPSQELINKINQLQVIATANIAKSISDAEGQIFYNEPEKANDFINEIIFNYLPYQNAFDQKEWAMGKTADGSYILLPKDGADAIIETGFNYKDLDGFNGTPIINPFDAFNTNIKEALANPNTDTKAAALSLLDIIKITQSVPPQNPSIITFTPEKYSKLNIYLDGHGAPKTINSPGSLASINIDFFNKTVAPALDNSYTQTLTYETCFGADVNAQAAFNSQDPHSFTIITGNSTLSRLTTNLPDYNSQIINIIKSEYILYQTTGTFSTPEQLQQKIVDAGLTNRFNNFFDLLQTSTAQGISSFFKNRAQTTQVYGITGTPSLKLATTDTWVTPDAVRENLLQISTLKDRVNVVNDTPFIYDLPQGGGLLASSNTILTPIEIKTGSYLPLIVPLSVGEKTHYIKEIIIDDPSTTVNMFLTQSIKPFFNELIYSYSNSTESIANKTIVIDSLKTKEGTATLLVTQDYAMYSLTKELDPLTGESPIHYIQLTKSKFSWENTDTFKQYIQAARDQATQEFIEIAKIQNISSTIQARQEALNVIGRLRGITNINLGTNDQLTIWNGTLDAITHNNNQPVSKEFLLTFSIKELQTFLTIITKYANNLSLTDPLTNSVSDTLDNANQALSISLLQDTLNSKLTISSEAALNWYITLTLEDQALIKNKFNTKLEDTILPDLDLTLLTDKEQILIETYIQETLSLSSDTTQIADLTAKKNLLAIVMDPVKFNEYLKNEFNILTALEDKSIMIDWISTLNDIKKTIIAQDITAFFIKEIINDPYLQSYQLSKLNITELFELKINLENFLSSSDADKTTILATASKLYGSPISLENVITNLSGGIEIMDQSIQKSFSSLSRFTQLTLIDPKSVNIYAQVFKELSFEMQVTIAQNLKVLKRASADLLGYQKSLLPERINAAQTTADLAAIKNDFETSMQTAGFSPSPTDMPPLYNSKYNLLEAAQNQRIAEHAPAIPNAGSTGTISFDPTVINEQTGQPIAPNNNPDNPNPINPETPGQLIPDSNPDYKDPDLEAEYEKEHEQEIAQEEAAKASEEANKEAQQEGRTDRTIA